MSISPTPAEAEPAVPRSIGRVLDLLEIVLAEGSSNLTAAATTSGLTPTTALRHLRALEARGYVERDQAGVFSIGPTMQRLAATVREIGPLDRLVTTARPHLDALAASTGESVYLAVSDGRIATYVATAESERSIRHVGWVGQNVALDGTAVGEALESPGTCVTRTGAVEPDITAISRALPAHGRLGVAVSVIGPRHRFTKRESTAHAAALRDTVDLLVQQLSTDSTAAAS